MRRSRGAVELGADIAFLEGITSIEIGRRVTRDLAPTPYLLNMVPGGVTLEISVAKAQELGFRVMIYPCFTLEPVYYGVTRAARELKSKGFIRNDEEGCKGLKETFRVCGLDRCIDFNVMARGTSYEKGFDEHVRP